MIILIQAEIAEKVLSNNDATIQGILLAVIVVLIGFLGILWKSKLADEKYIREQDKATIELCMTLTNTVDTVATLGEKNGEGIRSTHEKVKQILELMKQRLNHN